jgi:3'(2'), 5'-bisphosphate nucleotidase
MHFQSSTEPGGASPSLYESPPHMPTAPIPIDLTRALADARLVALLAWERIAGFYRGTFEVFEKESDGPATEADIMADKFIVAWLSDRYPTGRFGYLSEEAAKTNERLGKDACWIIDPIDGTRDFIEGKEDFAVQVGLAVRTADGTFDPVVGVVYQPVTGMLYQAATGLGAWRENVRLGSRERLLVSQVESPEECTLVVTRSNMGLRLRSAMGAIDAKSFYQAGSLGVKVAHVCERRADLYINTSRRFCKEWDTCAPHAIINEAGGLLTDLTGVAITYNKPDVYIEQGLVVANRPLHRDVVLRLAGVNELWLP